jgi:regulator of sigma E protease
VDAQTFTTAEEIRTYISEHGDDGVDMVVKKSDGSFATAHLVSEDLPEAGVHGVGVGLVKTGMVSFSLPYAVYHGVLATIQYTIEVVKAFGGLISNLIIHQAVSVDLSGPVGIAVMTGQVAAMGLVYLIQFTAVLSINLAVVNVLPFPALDGGRVLFLIIEKIRGKALNQRIEASVHNLGFALLMVLVILVTYRDFVRFGDQILGALKSMIGA